MRVLTYPAVGGNGSRGKDDITIAVSALVVVVGIPPTVDIYGTVAVHRVRNFEGGNIPVRGGK